MKIKNAALTTLVAGLLVCAVLRLPLPLAAQPAAGTDARMRMGTSSRQKIAIPVSRN